jgi:hypothetical protein
VNYKATYALIEEYPGAPGRLLQWARERREEPAATTPGRCTCAPYCRKPQKTRHEKGPARCPLAFSLAWMMVGDPEGLSSTERQAWQRAIEVCRDAAVIYPLIQKKVASMRSVAGKSKTSKAGLSNPSHAAL